MPAFKAYIGSLGCPKNTVDSEVMAARVAALGYEMTASPADAGLILLNTCAFILPAKEESIEEILQLARYKDPRFGKCRYLIVTGCLPQRYSDELPGLLGEVDLFLGTGEVDQVDVHLQRLCAENTERHRSVIGQPNFLMDASSPRILSTAKHSAYLKITEGCSNHCSYCVIPLVRGAARSRPPDDIQREAEALALGGVKEIILIGQDITAYGHDQREKYALADLVSRLASLKTIQWIRLLYAYPTGIDEDLLEVIKREEKVCKYIDLPVQHIDDRILKAMNRRGGRRDIERVIEQARAKIPGIALRTSLMVGFPGETQREFRRLLDFVRDTRFDHLGCFVYSREEGTLAAGMSRQISARIKEERRLAIMEEQAAISFAINREMIGTRHQVLVEGKSDRRDYPYLGRLQRQAPEIDGVTYFRGGDPAPGSLVDCTIVAADEYDLFVEILPSGEFVHG